MAQQASHVVQAAQPTLFNMPPEPQSTPDTPSEIPGTPTSTTTSLSAISTTAMKDGQRGGHIPPLLLDGSGVRGSGVGSHRFGHQHNPSTNSLEAERADRISRLTGLSSVSTLRPTYAPNRGSAASVTSGGGGGGGGGSGSVGNNNSNRFSGSGVFATTPTSGSGGGLGSLGLLSNNMAVPGPLTPAFFDAQGQPVAITKMSTVGTASATDSISGRTLDDNSTADGDTMTEDGDEDDSSSDDIKSMGTNYRYTRREGEAMMMDDDNLDNASRSVGGYEDRMSDDDGAASLVGFGEGAGSTVSGPIYHRRPLPPSAGSSAGAMAANNISIANNYNNYNNYINGGSSSGHIAAWSLLERTNSGLSDIAVMGSTSGSAAGRRADYIRSPLELGRGGSPTTPAPMALDDDVFVDNPTNGSIQAHPSALRETQRPRSHQQQQQSQYHNNGMVSREREAAEQLLQGVARYSDHEPSASRFGAPGPGGSASGGAPDRLLYDDRR